MVEPASGLETTLARLSPELGLRTWRFVAVWPDTAPQLIGAAIGTFRENEGVTAIVPSSLADELELKGPDLRRITLTVNSDLEGVGLTAAVSGALAEAGIACNVVAALHHDHLFVPASHADEALAILLQLQAAAR